MILRNLAAAGIVLGFAMPAWADTCLVYEPATVSVIGTLTMAHGYGPPNFGQDPAHDRKETYGLLTLDRPACVSGGDNQVNTDVGSIKAFQLVPDSPGRRIDRQLLGTRVVVSGTLFHRVSGGHTEVMILYTEIGRAR